MGELYFCNNENRRELVKESTHLNGIDYLEVLNDQKTLLVHFFHPLPGSGAENPIPADDAKKLTAQNILIEGGVRIRGIHVQALGFDDAYKLKVTVDAAGDFSTYTLRLVSKGQLFGVPSGFDPQLSAVDFSFKVDCPSDFDCAPEQNCPPDRSPEPEINYLAKDFNSFTRLMFDRLSVLTPGWQERNPADLQVTLVEMLAYVGDHLSYYQDAVATEAYLGTARRRVSIRRHARLLDYFMHDGCNARTWVTFQVEQGSSADGMCLKAGQAPLLSGTLAQPVCIDSNNLVQVALNEAPVVFETIMDVTLHGSHNEINFYTWGDDNCCLPDGSTQATLQDDKNLHLALGDFLLFEETTNPTQKGLPADPTHRQVVRLTYVSDPINDPLDVNVKIINIEWAVEDALKFPLCISATRTNEHGQPEKISNVSVARGNVTLADNGLTFDKNSPWESLKITKSLVPERVPELGAYRPYLDAGSLTYRENVEFLDAVNPKTKLKPSAMACMRRNVYSAKPIVELASDDEQIWHISPQFDLLSSGEFSTDFILELEADGTAYFRFGDDVHGRKPMPKTKFSTNSYRIGNGAVGNIGAEVLHRIVINQQGIIQVRNPLPAWGGTDPEAMETVRLYAPQAFRRQERAVTVADYAEMTERHPEVQKAAATMRWTGSWHTMFITIDRLGGREVDKDFTDEIVDFLNRYRLAGYDLEINGPHFVPLDIGIKICVKPGYFRSNVKKALLEAFSTRILPNKQRGFFHPDNFTFAQPVYLSKIYQTALSIAGVQSVDVIRFQRFGKLPNGELNNGLITPARLEIIRLDNDPNFAENGKLEFNMQGGIA